MSLLIDVLYVFWFTTVSEKRPYAAAVVSVLIGASGLFSIGSAIINPFMAIPYLLGLGVGTVVGMKLKSLFEKNHPSHR